MIYDIEAVGPLVLLENFPDQFRGSLWLHFLEQCGSIVNLGQWIDIRHPRGHPDWRYVEPNTAFAWLSHGLTVWKTVVGLSRGQLDGPWRVESLAFPGSLLRALRQELGGREGSYANTLLALLIREGGSTSEHRDGLSAVVLVSHVYLGATASDLGCVGECANCRALSEHWCQDGKVQLTDFFELIKIYNRHHFGLDDMTCVYHTRR